MKHKYNKGFLGVGMILAILAGLVVGGGVIYYTTNTPSVEKIETTGSVEVVESQQVEQNVISTNTNNTQQTQDSVQVNNTTQSNTKTQLNTNCLANTPSFVRVISPNTATYKFGDIINVQWEACNTTLDVSVWVDRFDQSGKLVLPNIRIGDLGLVMNYQKQIIGKGATGSFDIKIPDNGKFNDPVGGVIDLNNSSIKYKVRIEAFDGPSDSSDGYVTINTSSNTNQSSLNCNSSTLGVSFDYPKGYFYDQGQGRPSCVFVTPDQFGSMDAGKMIAGYIASADFTMFVGGATQNASFAGGLNAADVKSYPDSNQIKIWTDNGYKVEKKVNKNNKEYVLVYGKKERDMPYLSENQRLAIFRLKSAKDFSAIGFQLIKGNSSVFNQIIDSVNVY
jgi:hypothetical protein